MSEIIVNKVWLNEDKACEYCDLSKPLLREARDKGMLTYRRYKSKILYHTTDLDNFLKLNTSYFPSAIDHISEAKKWNQTKAK